MGPSIAKQREHKHPNLPNGRDSGALTPPAPPGAAGPSMNRSVYQPFTLGVDARTRWVTCPHINRACTCNRLRRHAARSPPYRPASAAARWSAGGGPNRPASLQPPGRRRCASRGLLTPGTRPRDTARRKAAQADSDARRCTAGSRRRGAAGAVAGAFPGRGRGRRAGSDGRRRPAGHAGHRHRPRRRQVCPHSQIEEEKVSYACGALRERLLLIRRI